MSDRENPPDGVASHLARSPMSSEDKNHPSGTHLPSDCSLATNTSDRTPQNQRLCPQHHRELEFYCRTDNTQVCSRCSIQDHKGHDIVELCPDADQSFQSRHPASPLSKEATRSTLPEIPVPVRLTVSSITASSASLSWLVSPEMEQTPHSFLVSYQSEGTEPKSISTESCSTDITGLELGIDYTVEVCTVSGEKKSQPASVQIKTEATRSTLPEIPVPVRLTVSSITASSANLSWLVSPEMEQTPHSFLVSYQSEGTEPKSISTESCSTVITGLELGIDYTVEVCTVSGEKKSQPASVQIKTEATRSTLPEIPVPVRLTVSSITASSASLSWLVSPEMEQTPHSFLVSYQSEGTEPKSISTESCSTDITGLELGIDYTVEVCTVSGEKKSQPASVQIKTEATRSTLPEIPVPECLTVSSSTASSASLSWSVSPEMEQTPHSFLVSYQSEGTEPKSISTESCSTDITGLELGIDYTVEVCTVSGEKKSQPAFVQIKTGQGSRVPEASTVGSVCAASPVPSLARHSPMDQTQPGVPDSQREETGLKSHSTFGRGQTPDPELQHGQRTPPPSVTKELLLSKLLSTLGLGDLHGGKLTLSSVLEINSDTVSEKPAQSLKQLPWTFLRKLMMANLNARNIKCAKDQPMYTFSFTDAHDDSDAINPLDVITALFHCSDPFLQQEMVSKMSMCQFAVPLLLPNCDTQQSTLMLWAMRDLVKKFRPHSLAGDKTFVEGRIIEMDIAMVSFVRLGESSLPKSQTLNKLLSNPQQQNDTFVHREMECGDVPRRISDGLVEVSWYLSCGKTDIDMFTQPVAIANLRGDGRMFKTQMSFLCQTSAAVFIFSDDLEGDLSTLNNGESRAELFLVTNSQTKTFNKETLRDTFMKHKVKETNVIIKKKQNDAEFVKALRFHVNSVIGKNPHILKVEVPIRVKEMAAVARRVGIVVDEDCTECTEGREKAKRITGRIGDVVEFKKNQLPLHGEIWKQISKIEKENCRMRNVGKDIEGYMSSLKTKEAKLRKEQQQMFRFSDAMIKFTAGISESGTQRLYFLKWLKIQLDTLSRQNLFTLREQYKDCCRNTPQNKELIADLDEQISNCSLGPEHFFRELGQIYECACSLPENNPARQKVQKLPALCAQMLLDGFPVELVDGDASNIPMKWIKEVLTQLHQLVDTKSKILVLTVLGVQSTGKSTLLNTMFGVQFAVSSGRCTRGAFMLLIKVSEELGSEHKCDFIMVIDTEGLKSPELAALETSYEHDNELATLVIGLSDITIINIAMENNTEMKDILQIVVHAFLRMKEVGKKRRCLFVHQNVSDMSAHDSNMRDRKKLMDQLDEMTQVAAAMEKNENYSKFTDAMDYDPDKDSHYIPGLWHGTPPMAPVNSGYSQAVDELKKSLIGSLQTSDAIPDATEFLKWTQDLWNAVKRENFIFNFRNSLVADAYRDLCIQYNTWECSFQSEMNTWRITKETMISNFGVTEKNVQMNLLRTRLNDWLHEASEKLHEEEQTILSNLEEYFEKKDSKVSLVEKYKQDFLISANSLRQQMEMSINHSLEKAVEIREGMEKVNIIKDKQMDTIDKKVNELLKDCKERKADLSEYELTREFEKMWAGIVSELSGVRMPEKDVHQDVNNLLWSNLNSKGVKVEPVKTNWFSGFKSIFSAITHMKKQPLNAEKIQEICDGILKKCDSLISDHISAMKRNNTGYHETYIRDLLKAVDDQLKNHQINYECETALKVHVCGSATQLFQKAHKEFNDHNDPQIHLKKYENIFLKGFLELFSEKDQCQKLARARARAEIFTETCVKPAVKDYVSKHLGQEIVKKMKEGDGKETYSTRTHFVSDLLKQLLHKDSFQKYKEYIRSYETFEKDWIKDQIIKEMSSGEQMQRLEKKLLSEIVKKITDKISSISKDMEIEEFIRQFCSDLEDQLVFPRDALRNVLILINAKTDQFAVNLKKFIEEMEKHLAQEYAKETGVLHITGRITHLPSKPHELLFSGVFGCREQCPFCATPCEKGGQNHQTHSCSIHRPEAFIQRHWDDSKKLVTDICTNAVNSGCRFKSSKTNGQWHPYKEYRDIYPDWEITGDPTMEASDYWRYVLMKFNNEFAKASQLEPADIPEAWTKLTAEDALRSLRESFNMK